MINSCTLFSSAEIGAALLVLGTVELRYSTVCIDVLPSDPRHGQVVFTRGRFKITLDSQFFDVFHFATAVHSEVDAMQFALALGSWKDEVLTLYLVEDCDVRCVCCRFEKDDLRREVLLPCCGHSVYCPCGGDFMMCCDNARNYPEYNGPNGYYTPVKAQRHVHS